MSNQPTDDLARASALEFHSDPKATSIDVAFPEVRDGAETLSQQLHRNALVQMGHSSKLR